MNIINELSRNVNEMTENINSGPPINFRTFAPRRDPFDDINKNEEKLTPSPRTKSREPQGLASIEITKNDFKISKDLIKIKKKELNNTELLSQRYFRIKDKIIQEE